MRQLTQPYRDPYPVGEVGSRFNTCEPMETKTEAKYERILCSLIDEGFNYRRRYDQARLAELSEDIKVNGLIAPVIVRKLDNGRFQLIVGGRRFKAYVMAFGLEEAIPAEIKVLTDTQATTIMMSENGQRQDPSVIEDAEGAARMLGLCNGDRSEAARRLGWDASKLSRRLAVMNAIAEVRDAYLEDKIQVGHVEILAALRKEVQAHLIAKILSQPTIPTVASLKDAAQKALLSLEAAIFDLKDCANCQFNSGFQQSMFETSFDGKCCSNRECYDGKTEEELTKRAEALKETYQVVRIVRPGDNNTVQPVRAEGPKALGEEQVNACKTCGDFGACVSGVPDKLGNVYKDVCFNKSCNDEKLTAYAKVVKAAKDAQEAAARAATGEKATGQQGAPVMGGATATGAKAPGATSPAASSAPRNAVREYREAVWRQVLKLATVKLPMVQNRALLMAICLTRPSDIDKTSAQKALENAGIELKNLKAASTIASLLSLDQQALGRVMQEVPAHLAVTAPIEEVKAYLTALNIQIEQYWKLNKDFLDMLTKTEIDAVCIEIGLADALDKHYKPLINGPKKDLVEKLLKVEGFKYVGAVPALMRWNKA